MDSDMIERIAVGVVVAMLCCRFGWLAIGALFGVDPKPWVTVTINNHRIVVEDAEDE
jgi:hypothetical protein